jgi:hypothetical protein
MTIELKYKLEIDGKKILHRIEKRIEGVQGQVDLQVMKDSNLFCPRDVGTLQSSVLIASELGSGVLVWDSPYARRQYYEAPNKSLDKNPKAQMKWFEVAKSLYKKDWVRLAQREYNQ